MSDKILQGTQTRENLMKAFAGESMARNRYCMFASKAEKECLIEIADIFRQTALNEKEHAEVFFKFLDGGDVKITSSYPSCLGDTKANLMCAFKYEEEEHSILYPEFAKVAEEEGFKKIATAFKNIAIIEAHHSSRYKKLFDRLNENTMFKRDTKVKWVCSHCGFIYENEEPPVKCPVCEKDKGYYELLCDCL